VPQPVLRRTAAESDVASLPSEEFREQISRSLGTYLARACCLARHEDGFCWLVAGHGGPHDWTPVPAEHDRRAEGER
jgi:hypothetical protein